MVTDLKSPPNDIRRLKELTAPLTVTTRLRCASCPAAIFDCIEVALAQLLTALTLDPTRTELDRSLLATTDDSRLTDMPPVAGQFALATLLAALATLLAASASPS